MTKVLCGTTLLPGSYPDEPLKVAYPVSRLSGVLLDFAVAVVREKFEEVRLLYAPHGGPPEATFVGNSHTSGLPYKALEDQELARELSGDAQESLDLGALINYVRSIAGNQIFIPLPGNAWRGLFPVAAA
jgi:hypothetical protein